MAMAPYNAWPVLILGFGVLYIAIARSEKHRHAFAYGWLFGFGYFVFGLYWIGNALLVEGNPYKWAWPLAVCGLPVLFAFYTALPAFLCRWFLDLKRWHGYIGFAVLLAGFEWLRGHLFTGFPWNLFGYTWIDFLEIAQLASLGGAYGLSLITVFWLSLLGFVLVVDGKVSKITLSSLVLVSVVAAYAYGYQRLSHEVVFHENVAVKIVQPNIAQSEKWQREKMVENFKAILDMSRYDGQESIEHTIIIWPETTIAPVFLNDPGWFQEIVRMLQSYPQDAVLIAGALRYIPQEATYFNSILQINQNGDITDTYDKSHLVPFGEYIPYQEWIPLAPVVQFQGFEAGNGVKSVQTLNGLSYSPLVCYEIIFPKRAVSKTERPDFMVNATNDAWYGISPGPYQHFSQARFRAIEEGVPVIRAANTGISSAIDPYGRVVKQSQLFERGITISGLPVNINLGMPL